MKTTARFLAITALLAGFAPPPARAFSISAVTLSPGSVVPPMTELRMTIDVITPSQAASLYAPTQISSNSTGVRVDVFPTGGMLTAIGALSETVTLGVFPAGTHQYEVILHPGYQANWGTRTNRGNFTVAGVAPPRSVVRIEATRPIAEEDSTPLDRLNLTGVFTISRSGPTNGSLPVYVQYAGSSTAGEDYPVLPLLVTIPAGAISTQIRVVPTPDHATEGLETLVATISNCPPPGLRPPCYDFDLDAAHSSATVFIREDGLTRASVAITNPEEGATFGVDEKILIEAIAIDLDGYISRLEFWDGAVRIGESEIVFVRAPDPGTPIHHSFEWTPAAPGAHTLTARAIASAGTPLISTPVHITVTQRPRVAITQPANGAEFPLDTAIEIRVEARDSDGYVRRAEFFANNRKIGEASVEFIRPPDPGQLQTFSFVWRHPAPGTHVLTARATDDGGVSTASASVPIQVGMSEPLPIVMVAARDPFAVKPDANTSLNTATFEIRRFGPTNGALVVAYSLTGTADNGIDYETLSGLATIPAGQRSVALVLRPLADTLDEKIETVQLRLEQPPPPSPEIRVINPYRVGRPQSAVAVISDEPWLPSPDRSQCTSLPGGLWHVCFAAEAGHNFRVEASRDLRNWETLFDAISSDGTWHFIDTDTPMHLRRFYRLAPEPVVNVD